MDSRQRKGLELSVRRITKLSSGHWAVPSQTAKGRFYHVGFPPGYGKQDCDCPDFQLIGPSWCKHVWAVRYMLRDKGGLPQPVPKSPARVKYPRDWRTYNHIKANELGWFKSILWDLCRYVPEPAPSDKGGRPRIPMADLVFACLMKVYLRRNGRDIVGHLRNDVEDGLITQIPQASTILNWFGAGETDRTPATADLLRRLIDLSSFPLGPVESVFTVDSMSLRLPRKEPWLDDETGQAMEETDTKKVHLIVGVKTHIIGWVTVTASSGPGSQDKTQFEPLVRHVARRYHVLDILADAQYGNSRNHRVAAQVGAKLYSPPRKDTTGFRGGEFEKAYHFYRLKKQAFWDKYKHRANAETTHSMLKKRLGTSVESKNDPAIECEILARVVVHNLLCIVRSLYEYKIDLDFGGQDDLAQKGLIRR